MSNYKKLGDLFGQLETIAENTAGGGGVSSDITHLGTEPISLGADVIEPGTLRVTIASDDLLLSNLNNNVGTTNSSFAAANFNLGAINVNTSNAATSLDSLNLCKEVLTTTDVLRVAPIDVDGVASVIAFYSGNIEAGVQRVCIASDDVLLSNINTNINTMQGHTFSLGLTRDFITGVSVLRTAPVDELGVSHNINFQDGDIEAGTQRVCLATDDINISRLLEILEDVYDSTAHTLKVSVAP